ncbi:MAG: hypothetical protein ACXVCF_20925, partial [Isosphaeraceae bacterium]
QSLTWRRTFDGTSLVARRRSRSTISAGFMPYATAWTMDSRVKLHRWRFKLHDGGCSTMRGQGVHRFAAEIRQDQVWVLV